MTGLFYPQHILYVKACEMAFEDCFYSKKWIEALDYGSLCLNSYKAFTMGNQVKYSEFLKSIDISMNRFQIWGNLGPLSYKLAIVYEKLENEAKMLELLLEAKTVIEITHGKKHRLYQEISRKVSKQSDL